MSGSESGRRRFLKSVVVLGGAAVGALLAVPGITYLLDPLLRRRKGEADWRLLGDADLLEAERPVALPVIGEVWDGWTRAPAQRLGHVWLRREEGQVRALSAECPHLGCRIGYDEEKNLFECPCHESAFALDGAVLDGPSPRPMDQLEARVREGRIEVRFRRFRTATEEQVEIG